MSELGAPKRVLDQLSGWQFYLTITTSVIAFIGVIFGALIPFVERLDFVRAATWTLSVALISAVAFLVAGHISKTSEPSADVRGYKLKLFSFGVFWSVFPFALCTFSALFFPLGKDCLCRSVPDQIVIELRKDGPIITPVSMDGVETLLKRTKRGAPGYPQLQHTEDVQRILNSIRSATSDPWAQNFISYWEQQEDEIVFTVMRLLADYTGKPFASSRHSDAYFRRLEFQRLQEGGLTILRDDEALEMLEMHLQGAVNFEPEADHLIVEAIQNYLTAAVTRLYGDLRNIKNEHGEVADDDFIDFVVSIPFDYREIVELVYYDEDATDFIKIECESPSRRGRAKSSSVIWIPRSEVGSTEFLQNYDNGPWPVGDANQFFSDAWWLEHATWQMLSRLSGAGLDNLGTRVDEFVSCGPQ